MRFSTPVFAAIAISTAISTVFAQAQSTAFMYQGRLKDGTSPVNGSYDLQFSLFTSDIGGNPAAGPVTNVATLVSNGLFTTSIDFGPGVFSGANYWLDIGVRTNGVGLFTELMPRQPIQPTPYAMFATMAGGLPGLTVQQNTSAPNVIGGSPGNYVTSVVGAVIGGGGGAQYLGLPYTNSVTADFGTVGGGSGNTVSGFLSTIAGGLQNTASGASAFIGGGDLNVASDDRATVGGGFQNVASYWLATVAGGYRNIASNYCSTVGGGAGNLAGGQLTTIGGGGGNIASGTGATAAGGGSGWASGDYATIGGGSSDRATNSYATVAGGYLNVSGGTAATTGGGYENAALGSYATIPGGMFNKALGAQSFAAGSYAQANHKGSFVWSDGTVIPTVSTAVNQFTAQASGGFVFYSGTNTGAVLPAGSGSWSSLSDRTVKKDFAPVNSQAILSQVAELPMTTWSYKSEPRVRHIGPMAQDFYAAFNVGEDDLHIAQVDEGGVALAAIQGLNEKLEHQHHVLQDELKKKDEEIESLKESIAELKTLVREMTKEARRR